MRVIGWGYQHYYTGDGPRSVCPVEFIRINLNPIREEYIEHVLRNTLNRQSVPFSVALSDRYPDKTLEDITKELHDISGGHPETLFRCLDSSDPLAVAPQGSCGRLGIK